MLVITFLNLASFARGESFPNTISVTSEMGTKKGVEMLDEILKKSRKMKQ